MDGPRDYHTEWSKSDREEEISYDILYWKNLKRNNTSELTYKTKQVHKLRKLAYGFWGKGQGEQIGSLGWTCIH